MSRLLSLFLLSALAVMAPRVVAAQSGPGASGVDLIPRSVFFGNPERANVQISPDGTRISFLAANEGVLNIWTQGVEPGAEPEAVTSSTDRPIRSYLWAMNGEQIVYAQDRGGDENFHLYAVDLETGVERDLTPFENVQARIIAVDRAHPDTLLVGVNNRDPRLHDVLRVNTRTGESEMVFENTQGYVGFQADSDFDIRLATMMTRDGGMKVFSRDAADQPWYQLVQWGPADTLTSGPLGFSRDGETIYLTDSRQTDTGGLWAFEIDAEEGPAYRLLASDPRVDLASVVIDPITGRPQAVAFDYTRREWQILDESIRDDWEYLTSVADGELQLLSRDLEDRTWIVSYLRDDGPVAYYLYDRPARSARFLFTNRPALEELELAEMQPVVIPARDGLELVSYLTRPVGAATNLPMVLLVHGGPWGRDSWGYNALHQWLANRGYAVLSVNFRGSTGFGKEFVNAGDREWAGRMHDDLIDAVNWAVDQGIADPDRVAIMGGSYGGYATLVGLTFTPEFFAAGVDIVGPSHVKTLLESIPPYWEPLKALFEGRVGRLDEPEFLDQISPLTRVDEIERPLLIGQGANDPRVKEAESRQIVEAMQAKGLPVTYVVFPDEGHGFARPENSLAFFGVTEAFLAQHLGGRYEPIESVVRQSSAQIEAGADLIPGLGGAEVELELEMP